MGFDVSGCDGCDGVSGSVELALLLDDGLLSVGSLLVVSDDVFSCAELAAALFVFPLLFLSVFLSVAVLSVPNQAVLSTPFCAI